MKHKQMIEALEAFEEDGEILFRRIGGIEWRRCNGPLWDFSTYEYLPVRLKKTGGGWTRTFGESITIYSLGGV